MTELFENFGKTDNTCRSCKHRQRWEFGSKVIQYCGVRNSNRTENGLLKIRCKDEACFKYESQTQEQTD